MGKFNRYQGDSEQFGKCEACHCYIPIEHYFGEGESIICCECGTQHILTSKNPINLTVSKNMFNPSDYYGDLSLPESIS